MNSHFSFSWIVLLQVFVAFWVGFVTALFATYQKRYEVEWDKEKPKKIKKKGGKR